MAIIALIVTPLVMSIIRKARISANKRSIDAYGRSIELAIAGYLMDTGSFPTSIEQLTVEYSGDEVVCETTNLNSDSSIYLAGCTVGGRSVEGYTYGKEETIPTPTYDAYTVGDEVSYNDINYYVIKDSSVLEETVTLLKAESLTAEEITTYSAGAGAQIGDNGEMEYHTTSNVYNESFVKIAVDAWKEAKAPLALEARLLKKEEIDFETREVDTCGGYGCIREADIVKNHRIYDKNGGYWTMTPDENSSSKVIYIQHDGIFDSRDVNNIYHSGYVRPVIVLPKSALTTP